VGLTADGIHAAVSEWLGARSTSGLRSAAAGRQGS